MKKLVVFFLVVLCFVLFCGQSSKATVYGELQIVVYPGQGITAENLDKERFDFNLGDNYWKVYQLGQPESISWQPAENGVRAYILYASYGLGFLINEDGKMCLIDIWNTYAKTAEGVKIGDAFEVAEKIYDGKFQPLYDAPDQQALNNQYIMICKGIRFYGIKCGKESNITCINILPMEAEK